MIDKLEWRLQVIAHSVHLLDIREYHFGINPVVLNHS